MNLNRTTVFLLLILVIASSPILAQTTVDKDALTARLNQTNAELKAIDRVTGTDRPPINRENLSWIDATREESLANGYLREVKYWDVRKVVSEEKLELLKLQKQVLEAQLQDQTVTPELQNQLKNAEAKVAARILTGEQKQQADAAWKRISTALAEANPLYSWHTVKVHLLRDMINRCKRASFYKKSATDTSAFDASIIDIIELNRQWEADYGEIYFSHQEQQIQGIGGAPCQALATQAEALFARVKQMQNKEAALEKKVLSLMSAIDPNGKYKDLGIPYRKKNTTLDSKGRPSDLLFASLGFGTSGMDLVKEAPLCFDMHDISFSGTRMKSRGIPDEVDPARLSEAKKLMQDQNYLFKQPIWTNTGLSACAYADINLLPEEQRSDPELYLRKSDGKYSDMSNIWHPAVRSLLADNLTAVAKYYRTAMPGLFMYDKITWEPGALGGYQDVLGYNKLAVEAFRAKMAKKFGTIAKLNKAWKTSYQSFESIEFPKSPFQTTGFKPNALSYEFYLFRTESWTDFMGLAIGSLQAGDPGRPIAAELNGMTGTFINGNIPSNRLWKKLPLTFVDDHHNNWAPSYAALNMHYSLCLYSGKQPIEAEYIWTFPRMIEPKTEDDYRVTGELSLWRKMVWGRKILNVFGDYDGWGYHHNFFDEQNSYVHQPSKYYGYGGTGAFVREAATSIVIGKKRAREFWPYLKNTEVVKPKIALIVPTTSMINEYPFEALSITYPVYERGFMRWDRLLGTRDLDFRYVPEDVILDGSEKLAGVKVVILPYMTYFPKGLADKLVKWTSAGGTLIAEGVPGVLDAYGFSNPELMRKVFGSEVSWKYTGTEGRGTDWRWDLSIKPRAKQTKLKASIKGKPALIASQYGKGTALVSAGPFNLFIDPNVDKLGPGMAFAVPDKSSVVSLPDSEAGVTGTLYKAIASAIGTPSAKSTKHKFELVTRADSKGRRYLFVTNAQLSETVADEIVLDGKYKKVYDLGLGSRCIVPSKPAKGIPDCTAIKIRLAPGEGTCLELVK